MLKSSKKHFGAVALILVVFLLSGCFGGSKPFNVVVELDPALKGVEIRSGSAQGKVLGTTNEKGVTEFKVDGETTIVPVSEGYTFTPESEKVTKAGKVSFKATAVEEPALTIESVSPVAGISVLIGETPFDELELPETVEVTMNDETKVELEVEWDSEGYDYEVAETYTIQGELVLIDGIANPGNLVAEVQVRVRYIPEDEEDLYDEAGANLNDEMEALDLGAIAEDIELVDTFTVGESVFSVAWASSNPEVLGVDGKINPTAQDEEVVLTATLTLETSEISAQSSSDPRVLEYVVTVLADPQKKAIAEAELATAAVEAIEGPTHYDEVAAIEELFEAADAAVALVDDVLTRYEFVQRIEEERAAFDKVLAGHVTSVNAADTDLDLFEALDAFWTVDMDLSAAYKSLVDSVKGDLITVHDIQENIVEKAPLFSEEESVVAAVVEAAKEGDSLIKFKDTLLQYAAYFERVMFEDNAALNEYKDGIAELAEPTIEDIQGVIDGENLASATAAVVQAEGGVKRADWNKAVALLEFVADGDAKDGLQARLDAHDLIIKVSEATTPAELRIALEDLEIEYVYVTLSGDYMDAIADDGATAVNTFDGIQNIVNDINKDNVDDILEDIAAIDENALLNLVQVLLEKLDKATPILDGATEIDFDLADEELGFDAGRLSFYLAKLADLDETITIAKVVAAIKGGNAEALEQFDKFVLEVNKATAMVNTELKFTITAKDKKDEAYKGFNAKEINVNVVVGDEEAAVNATFAQDVLAVSTGIKFDEIGSRVATLKFKIDDKEYTLTTDVVIDAKPAEGHSIIETDEEEYASGDDIEITVTLFYAKDKVLTTENEAHAGVITIGADVYNREFAFANGVAVVTVPARTAQDKKVEVEILKLTLQSDESIKIEAGEAQQLLGQWSEGGSNVTLTVKDARGNTVSSFKGTQKVEVAVHPVKTGASSLSVGVPDEDGIAYVDFVAGVAKVKLEGSPLLKDLAKGNYEVTVRLVELDLSVVLKYTVSG